jgi:16S rRNA (adenine1518-N6/adenine1519-N6)-dimethyltransferase
MVQREVGERLAAAPGGRSYGTPSVLAQLGCDVEVLRAIPRNVFFPVPNVDSVLIGMRRRAGAPPVTGALRALVSGSFAHRRKTLAGSVALAGGAPGRSREQLRGALEQLGHTPDARAERLTPADFRDLAELLGL